MPKTDREPKQFRKKPVVIEAMQFVPGWFSDVAVWCGGRLEKGSVRPGYSYHLIVPTLEGDHRADVDDWIIKGVQGEFYPCKPDIFAATYEPAKHHIASTDTGGVEGPYKVEDGNTVTGPTIHGLHMSTDAQGVVDSLNAAWRLGHKAGASGSGDAAGELAEELRRLAEVVRIADTQPDAIDLHGAASDITAVAIQLSQNPASGSDGLRARVEKVLECVEDYGRKLDKGGGEHRMYLRQFIQKELPHKLAAALSDGGMGDA